MVKIPMAENSTAKSQTSESLSLKNSEVKIYLRITLAKNHTRKFYIKSHTTKSRMVKKFDWRSLTDEKMAKPPTQKVWYVKV